MIDVGVKMNAVLLAVVVMVGLSLARVHVVLSLLIGALIGGLLAGVAIIRCQRWRRCYAWRA